MVSGREGGIRKIRKIGTTIVQPLRIACHSMAKIIGTTVIYRRCLTRYESEYVECM